jgi:hypothetical protein
MTPRRHPPRPPRHGYVPDSWLRALRARHHAAKVSADVCAWCLAVLPPKPVAELSDGRGLCAACAEDVPR